MTTSSLQTYQIVLIIILILNLFIWIVVIAYRLFCIKAIHRQWNGRGPNRRVSYHRRRGSNESEVRIRRAEGYGNRAFLQEDNNEGTPFSISEGMDAPPTYEEATKYAVFRNGRQGGSSQQQQLATIHPTSEQVSTIRRPFIYEQAVVLTVPEERTSTSENRLLLSLDSTPIIRPLRVQNQEPINKDNSSIDETPFTFTIDNIGPQSAKILKVQNTTVTLSDGEQLIEHSGA